MFFDWDSALMPNHARLGYWAAAPCVRCSLSAFRSCPCLTNALVPAGAINALQGQV